MVIRIVWFCHESIFSFQLPYEAVLLPRSFLLEFESQRHGQLPRRPGSSRTPQLAVTLHHGPGSVDLLIVRCGRALNGAVDGTELGAVEDFVRVRLERELAFLHRLEVLGERQIPDHAEQGLE